MLSAKLLWNDVKYELRRYFSKPRTTLNGLVINSIISVVFFLVSYWLGAYSQKLVPIAAATILLWALADASLTNQLLFNRKDTQNALKKQGSLKRLLLVKNLAIAVLSIPLTIAFGLMLVLIVGKWSELLYGAIMTFALIWGWLGISNAMSVYLPFELLSLKQYLGNKHVWIRYGFVYCLPWIILPIYAVIMTLPILMLGWTKAEAAQDHRVIGILVILALSLIIWFGGLLIADKYSRKTNSKIKQHLKW